MKSHIPIDPTYIGTSPLANQTFIVIYEVSGGEDGPQINNFTIDGDGFTAFRSQESSRRPRPERLECQGDEYHGTLNTSVARGTCRPLCYTSPSPGGRHHV
jgi:hypothetical protein